MILWLASYPKSGNTWVRLIISQLLYWDENYKKNTLEYINKFGSYPKLVHYLNIPEFKGIKKISNKEDIVKNWVTTQEIINLNSKIKIFKTHNSLCKFQIKGVDYKFTNLENTIGAIYIIRDPRSLISSIHHHLSLNTLEDAVKMLITNSTWGGLKSKPVGEFLSSWEIHYLSWKRFPKNFLLIKYEDLIKDTNSELIKIINFLKKFIKIETNEIKIKNILDTTNFKYLKNLEKEGKFNENAYENINKKKEFFHLGPNNNWENILKNKIKDEIEEKLSSEMKELGYI